MKEAVDCLITKGLNITLAYEKFESLSCTIPDSWDWVFIARDSDLIVLEQGGGWVPPKEYWGLNLLDEKIKEEIFERYCERKKN